MKSKYAPTVAGYDRTRVFRNNRFIVEPSYADRFNKDRFLLNKDFYYMSTSSTYQAWMEDVIIEDNFFDMYILSIRYSSVMYTRLYKFNRNTVLMDTAEHSLSGQAYINAGANAIPRTAEFKDNILIYDTGAFGAGIGTWRFALIYNPTSSNDMTTVNFSGNQITSPDYVFAPSSVTAASGTNTVINFTNNIINGIQY
jgi:hypothetical protein